MLRGLTLAALRAVPAPLVSQARVSWRASTAERLGRLALRPLRGAPVPVQNGPARGLELRAEPRSLAWLTGKVEREVQRTLVEHVRPGDTVVDAGASIGFLALLSARLVGPEGRVVAFEPDPDEAASARANAAHNGLENVEVVEAALSRNVGSVYLDRPGEATARVLAVPVPGALSVPATSLDAFLAGRPELVPALVKIDVEGAEADVLAGMAVTIERVRPVLVIEQHGDPSFLETLAAAGYAARPLEAATFADAPWWAHVLAVPHDA